jgi:hypothetical protein
MEPLDGHGAGLERRDRLPTQLDVRAIELFEKTMDPKGDATIAIDTRRCCSRAAPPLKGTARSTARRLPPTPAPRASCRPCAPVLPANFAPTRPAGQAARQMLDVAGVS